MKKLGKLYHISDELSNKRTNFKNEYLGTVLSPRGFRERKSIINHSVN